MTLIKEIRTIEIKWSPSNSEYMLERMIPIKYVLHYRVALAQWGLGLRNRLYLRLFCDKASSKETLISWWNTKWEGRKWTKNLPMYCSSSLQHTWKIKLAWDSSDYENRLLRNNSSLPLLYGYLTIFDLLYSQNVKDNFWK